ncbi:MAG: aspartate carbamoyltransferase regulatory subunit [Thermoplasmatota archaeon]
MKELKVQPIRNGTVIDHIAPGRALEVMRILGFSREGVASTVMVAQNVPTSRPGSRKDILKIEDRELDPDEVNKVALIAPSATINIVREYDVTRKSPVALPHVIEGIVRCPNANCVTNHEPATTAFDLLKPNPPVLRCQFCDRLVDNVMECIRA